MTIIERARKCIATRQGAVSGAGGHATTYGVAATLVWGFGLSPEEAMPLMWEYNQRCDPAWSEHDLWHKVRSVLTSNHKEPRGHLVNDDRAVRGEVPSYEAKPEKKSRRKTAVDLELLQRMQRKEWVITPAWLRERSPVDPRDMEPEAFLDAVFAPEDKVMVFTGLRSTGDYMRWRGKTYRLGKAPGERAQEAQLPRESAEGMTFLVQPVDGQWHQVAGAPRLSRRTWRSVVKWPHMLLESDSAPHDQWLNVLCQLKLPILGIVSSGGRSLHALVRVDCTTKEEWDECAGVAMDLLTRVGCDGQAMQGVVYMRLPGTMRHGKLRDGKVERFPEPRKQRLLYCNPAAEGRCIGEGVIFERP